MSRPPAGAQRVVEEWSRRTQAEYASAAIAHEVTLWLIQLGAPPDLIRDGLRVVGDELTHSELSAAVAGAAGGVERPVTINASDVAGFGGGASVNGLGALVLRFFCIGETVAVPLFRMLRSGCTVPVARQALDRVLRDEAAHRQFGWDVLDWLLTTSGEPVRLHLEPLLAPALDDVTRAYASSPTGHGSDALEPDVAKWGLAPPSAYAATVLEAVRRELLPRFAERDLVPARP
ncbi:MAG: ferritin-like domain-containing protein [Acidimicrobiales bacterium]